MNDGLSSHLDAIEARVIRLATAVQDLAKVAELINERVAVVEQHHALTMERDRIKQEVDLCVARKRLDDLNEIGEAMVRAMDETIKKEES